MAEPLSIAIHSGAFDRVHYGLVLASAAAAIDRKTLLFFAGSAVEALRADGGWHRNAAAADEKLRAAGIAGFETLLEACRDLGVGFLVCELALVAAGLERDQLRGDLPLEVAGAVTFLNRAAGGAMLFI